jgi:hypothetical protein
MSALPLKADIRECSRHVRFGPIATKAQQKDCLTVVSTKYDQMFQSSDRHSSGVLALSAPAEQCQHAEAGGEECESIRERCGTICIDRINL